MNIKFWHNFNTAIKGKLIGIFWKSRTFNKNVPILYFKNNGMVFLHLFVQTLVST